MLLPGRFIVAPSVEERNENAFSYRPNVNKLQKHESNIYVLYSKAQNFKAAKYVLFTNAAMANLKFALVHIYYFP